MDWNILMIKTIKFKKKDKKFHWRNELNFFNTAKIDFKKGINIVCGPTGSGKSTLLDMIAHYMAAKQGGVSCVTEQWIRDNVMGKDIGNSFNLVHDGQPVLYASPHIEVGVSGRQLDDDFFPAWFIKLRGHWFKRSKNNVKNKTLH